MAEIKNINPWHVFIKQFRKEHPEIPYKELIQSKKTKKAYLKIKLRIKENTVNLWVKFINEYRKKYPKIPYHVLIQRDETKKAYKIMKNKSKKKIIRAVYNNIINTANINKNPDYMPKGGYIYDRSKTILTKINQNDALLRARIEIMKEKGSKKIKTREQLLKYPIGSIVSYITKDGLYRSGGFLRAVEDDYFCLMGGITTKPISFCVQFNNTREIYIRSPIENRNRKGQVTNFPVILDGKIIYYAKDNFDVRRFKQTKRYLAMLQWSKDIKKLK